MWDSLEPLSLESDSANHNTWNGLLNLITPRTRRTGSSRTQLPLRFWTGSVRSHTRSGIRDPLNDTPNPRLVCWVCRPGRQWGVAHQRMGTATRPKGLRSFSLKTDGNMILLLLLFGFCVRYPWTAWEADICARASPARA